jgi:hypothetical protein
MIVIRAIKGAPFKSSVFREEIIKAANEIKDDALADFKKTTANWTHKPKFSSKILTGASAGGVQVQVATDDAIYRYIDEGTKVRYATMSKDWESKTEPDVVGTFPGKGRRLFINKKRPRPGIKARKFSKNIAKTTQKELARVTKNALARAARRSGHGIK